MAAERQVRSETLVILVDLGPHPLESRPLGDGRLKRGCRRPRYRGWLGQECTPSRIPLFVTDDGDAINKLVPSVIRPKC